MQSTIVYKVIGNNIEGTLPFVMVTSNPFKALSDALLKTMLPNYFSFQEDIADSLRSYLANTNPAINESTLFDIELKIGFSERSLLFFHQHIFKTTASEMDILDICDTSHAFFNHHYYKMALRELNQHLYSWSDGDIHVAKTLAFFACRDKKHPFWRDCKKSPTVLELSSYKNPDKLIYPDPDMREESLSIFSP